MYGRIEAVMAMENKIIFHQVGKDPMYKIWHALEDAMFIYMHSDGGSIVCREKLYPIKKGVLCLVGAGRYHYTMPENPDEYDRNKLFVDEKELSEILNILNGTNSGFSASSFVYAQIDERDIPAVEAIFLKMHTYKAENTFGKWIRASCIVELLAYLQKYSLESARSESDTMTNAISYINQNVQRDLTIDEICKVLHISKYHFCRAFKKATGTTVMKYIQKTRIVMAKSMLLNENLSVSEISARCGFSSVSYFSRIFKEETGVSPFYFKRQGGLIR